ncbi:MAG: hypothetical protein WC867_02150 [Candidatus Pacearchaeota archaeon]|jgi:hypothetical protein
MVENKDRSYLEAIQNFADEYFISIEEAEKIISNIVKVEDSPKFIADEINMNLGRNLESITYPARPERVSGIINIVEDAKIFANNRTGLHYEQDDYDHRKEPVNILNGLEPRLSLVDLSYDCFQDKSNKIIRVLTPYFVSSNKKGINYDLEFVRNTANLFVSGFNSISQKIPNEDRVSCESWIKDIRRYMNQDHPEIELSEEQYKENQKKLIQLCIRSGVKPLNVYQRIVKEGLRDSPSHQRKLLVSWLDNFYVKSYHDAIKLSQTRIKIHEKELSELISYKSPEFLIELERDRLESQRYINGILDKHKESIVNYLGR